MGYQKFLRMGGIVLLSLLGLESTTTAKNGRDFAGFYNLVNVTDKGAEVEGTLILRLFNYSGSDLKQVAATVRETPPGAGTLASFPRIALWQDGTDVVIQQHIAIPRQEFQQWSGHGEPNVFLIYKDDNGREFQKTAQVSPHPITVPEGAAQ